MMEPALDFMLQALPDHTGKRLLIADEQLDTQALLTLKPIPDLTLLTNRYDLYLAAQENNIPCQFNDMDLAELNDRYQLIAYRISKEKALVHHIINQAPHYLAEQGQLLLCGYKNEGIKTYISKAERYLNTRAEVSKGERQMKLAAFTPQAPGEPLDDRHYRDLVCIGEPDSLALYSKPGQYGWNKIDKGSEALINACREYVNATQPPSTVLDLGCGYGYLSVMAWALGAKHIVATDNNAAALASCRYNFEFHNIPGEVIADDCASDIHHQYEMVLCNPPFHLGFDTRHDLTEKFLHSISNHLKNNGVAFVVVSQFIALETVAPGYFKSIELVSRDKSFKVFKLSS